MSLRKLTLAGISMAVAVCATPALAIPGDTIFPTAGKWVAYNKHGHYKQTFRVSPDEKHVYDFKLRIPYTCAEDPSTGHYIIVTRARPVKINGYNGYFSAHGGNLQVQGLTNDLSYSFSGFFSEKGRHSKLAKGDIDVDFDTIGGDICNDRFDTWKGAVG